MISGIREVSGVSERFHARLNAKGKVYQYTCYIGDEKPVFDRMYMAKSVAGMGYNGTPDRDAGYRSDAKGKEDT